jgi:hypothetical protein
MLGRRGEDTVELECPECGLRVKATREQAREGKVRCPRGHEFGVMGILGDLAGPRHSKR